MTAESRLLRYELILPNYQCLESPSLGGDLGEAVPWTQYGYYLYQRPSFTFDPLFHAGCYYVQEASSMFMEQVLKQTVDLSQPLRVSTLRQRREESQLIYNHSFQKTVC